MTVATSRRCLLGFAFALVFGCDAEDVPATESGQTDGSQDESGEVALRFEISSTVANSVNLEDELTGDSSTSGSSSARLVRALPFPFPRPGHGGLSADRHGRQVVRFFVALLPTMSSDLE